MSKVDFFEKLSKSPKPVIVDFWAPWCGPCRVIGPAIEQLAREYTGRVEVWKVNADNEPDLMRSLRIFGIPTVIAFHGGQEVIRRTGAAPARDLQALFEAALSGNKPGRISPSPSQRTSRLVVGLVLIILAIVIGLSGITWLLAGLGALIMFSGVYDRCPIYRMLSTRLADIFVKKSVDM